MRTTDKLKAEYVKGFEAAVDYAYSLTYNEVEYTLGLFETDPADCHFEEGYFAGLTTYFKTLGTV